MLFLFPERIHQTLENNNISNSVSEIDLPFQNPSSSLPDSTVLQPQPPSPDNQPRVS